MIFAVLGNSRTDDHPPTKKPVEGNDDYLNPGRKVRTVAPANQQPIGTLCRYERIKKYLVLALGGAMSMAWWDVIGYYTIYP